MVVRINITAKTSNVVHYNENKVKIGEAKCLSINNCHLPISNLSSPIDKITLFRAYELQNEGIKKPGLHISLSFHPDEQLSDKKLQQIGEEYMQQLGYGQQPFLIYRHEDRPHPHIHIVSVNIDQHGQKIKDSFQRQRSNRIRKNIEVNYSLVKAEEQGKERLMNRLLPEHLDTFSDKQIKKAIGNIVRTALSDYSFSSLKSFSTYLEQHQVRINHQVGVSTAGKPYQGITFQLLNPEIGQPMTPAIKASSFAFAPTAERLEIAFRKGQKKIHKDTSFTALRIDRAKNKLEQFSSQSYELGLRQAGIQLVKTSNGYVYIDHTRKLVVSEAELPARYSQKETQLWLSGQSAGRIGQPNSEGSKIVTRSSQSPTRNQLSPTNNSIDQAIHLRKRVSHFYQQARQKGFNGGKPIYFESTMIAQFPFDHLVNQLEKEGVTNQHATEAVYQFELYKQSQLPAIRAKEQDYFETTATVLAKLASELPLDSTSKTHFLTGLGYQYLESKGMVSHSEKPDLKLELTQDTLNKLQLSNGPIIPMGKEFTRNERQFFLATATNQPLPPTLSLDQLNIARLSAIVGAKRMDTHWPALNQRYVDQLLSNVPKTENLQTFLQDRGMVLQRLTDESIKVGFVKSPASSYVPLPKTLVEKMPPLASIYEQQFRLQTTSGNRLIQLSQALDSGNQKVQNYLLNLYRNNADPTLKEKVTNTYSLQAWLRTNADLQLRIQQRNLSYILSHKSSVQLSFQQIRSISLPGLLPLVSKENQREVQSRYLQKQAEAIGRYTLENSKKPVSVLTMIGELYKRGIGITYQHTPFSQNLTVELITLDRSPAIKSPLPTVLSQPLHSIPLPQGQQPTLLKDPSWIGVTTSNYRQLVKLANALDQGKETQSIVNPLRDRNPNLPVEPAAVLNALVVRPLLVHKTQSTSETESYLDFLNQLKVSSSQEGLFDIVGESLSIAPKRGKRYKGGDEIRPKSKKKRR